MYTVRTCDKKGMKYQAMMLFWLFWELSTCRLWYSPVDVITPVEHKGSRSGNDCSRLVEYEC